MKLTNITPKGESVVGMIEHQHRNQKHIFVATTNSVYVLIPKDSISNKSPYLKPIPFEVEDA